MSQTAKTIVERIRGFFSNHTSFVPKNNESENEYVHHMNLYYVNKWILVGLTTLIMILEMIMNGK